MKKIMIVFVTYVGFALAVFNLIEVNHTLALKWEYFLYVSLGILIVLELVLLLGFRLDGLKFREIYRLHVSKFLSIPVVLFISSYTLMVLSMIKGNIGRILIFMPLILILFIFLCPLLLSRVKGLK